MKTVSKYLTLATLTFATAGQAHSLFPASFLSRVQPPTTQPTDPDQPTPPVETLDIAKANVVINETLGEIIQNDPIATSLKLSIDEASDLDLGNTGLRFTATLNDSIWAPGRDVVVQAYADSERHSQQGDKVGFLGQVGGGMQTDTLAITRWLASKALGASARGAAASFTRAFNPPGDLGQRVFEIIEDLSKAQTVRDIFIAATNLKHAVMTMGTENDKKYLRPLVIKYKSNDEIQFLYLANWEFGGKSIVVKNFVFNFKSNILTLNVMLDAFIDNGVVNETLAQFKSILLAVQQRDEGVIEGLREVGTEILQAAERIVLGKN